MEKNVKVHCLTNPVTMQSVANVLLAAGGSAVMAQDEQEVEEITAICQATLLNTGVPDERKILYSCRKMCEQTGASGSAGSGRCRGQQIPEKEDRTASAIGRSFYYKMQSGRSVCIIACRG